MKKLAVLSIAALTISAIYLYAWPSANLFYAAVVLFHVGLGVLFCIGGLRLLPVAMRQSAIVNLGALLLAIGAVLGLVLIYTGASRPYTKLLLSRAALSAFAVALLAGWWLSQRDGKTRSPWIPALGMIAVAIVVSIGAKYSRDSWSKRRSEEHTSELQSL